jgi:ABC-type multidrug transport system fused ATPase/permease subunit
MGFLHIIEKMLFSVTGENLTAAVRVDLLKGLLFKQLSWFDSESRAPGILTNVLSEDVQSLNGMTTETISTLVEAFLGLTLGLCISLYLCWQ